MFMPDQAFLLSLSFSTFHLSIRLSFQPSISFLSLLVYITRSKREVKDDWTMGLSNGSDRSPDWSIFLIRDRRRRKNGCKTFKAKTFFSDLSQSCSTPCGEREVFNKLFCVN
jgi:hypothetical protein